MAGFDNDVIYGTNIDLSNSLAGRGGNATLLTDGQMLIATTATNAGGTHVNVGTITSPGGTITVGYSTPNITLDLAGGGEAIDSIGTQTGTNPIVPTAAGLVTINGAVVAAGTHPIRSDGTGANTMAMEVQISQAIAATDATKIGLSNFNSAQFSVDANGFVSSLASGTLTSVVTVNATPQFVLGGSTETIDFNLVNLVLGSSLPVLAAGTNNVGIGAAVMATLTSGIQNVGIGTSSTHAITSGQANTMVGYSSGNKLTSGNNNTLIGSSAGTSLTTGTSNTAVGTLSLFSYTTGATNQGSNTAIGENSLSTLTTGVNNTGLGVNAAASLQTGTDSISIGFNAASSYSTNESSNICIGNIGTVADSNKIRIGTQGSSAGQQNATFIAGIVGVTTSNSQAVTIDSTTGQLGVTAIGSGFTWNDVTGTSASMAVSNGYLSDNAGLVTLTLPATAVQFSTIKVSGYGAGGWIIAQNANQQIINGILSSTVGVTGSLASTNRYDAVELLATVGGASTIWKVQNGVGNITTA